MDDLRIFRREGSPKPSCVSLCVQKEQLIYSQQPLGEKGVQK